MPTSPLDPTATYQCPDCRRARLFEQLGPGPDAGDATSGEWACTVCGAALLVDPALLGASREERPAYDAGLRVA